MAPSRPLLFVFRCLCALLSLVGATDSAALASSPEGEGPDPVIFHDGFETEDTQLWTNGSQKVCDGSLALDDTTAVSGANAIGICQTTTLEGSGPGLISAAYSTLQGAALSAEGLLGIGILDDFGPNNLPTQGARLLGLSSGRARSASDLGYSADVDRGVDENQLAGFPPPVPWCSDLTLGAVNDPARLTLTLRVPANANSFRVALQYFTRDYPIWVCTSFSDLAVVLVDPAPVGAPASGNVARDTAGNPLSVNTSLIAVCADPGEPPYICPLGDSALIGTGFDTNAATGLLRLEVPVAPDTVIDVSFAIWDSGDGTSDSTLLIDEFRWSADAVPLALGPAPE